MPTVMQITPEDFVRDKRTIHRQRNPSKPSRWFKDDWLNDKFHCVELKASRVELFGETALFFPYSGVNAANVVTLQAKRR